MAKLDLQVPNSDPQGLVTESRGHWGWPCAAETPPSPLGFLCSEYYQVVTIPSGARSIRIYETNVSTSYISVRNALKKYYLNGRWAVDWPGQYKFSGTTFDYRRSHKEPESLTSPGPTNETLIVEVNPSLLLLGLGRGVGGIPVGSRLC